MSAIAAVARFVGRDTELERLRTLMDEAMGGQTRLVLLAGEPGIGKTRLASELGQEATERGMRVAWGRCWESGGAPAYWPWTQLMAALPETVSRPSLAEAPGLEAVHARFELMQATASFLTRVATDSPIFGVLDDIHAADVGSLLLLQFLARHVSSARLFIVGTYRDVEARSSREVADALGAVQRDAVTLTLKRLERPAVGAYLEDTMGSATEALLTAVYRTTGGNPLFVGELARLLVAEGVPDLAADPGALPIPHSVRDAIRRRMVALPESCLALLGVGSAMTAEMDANVLAEVSDVELDAALGELHRAENAGIVVARAPDRYAFGHALMREVLYRDLPRTRRVAIHARVAAALAGRLARGIDVPEAELAHHYLEAGPEALAAAVDHAERAAGRMVQLGSYDDAVALLSRARRAIDLAGGEPRLGARIELGLGRARLSAGHAEQGRASCVRAADIARTLGDQDLLAEAALAYGEVLVPGSVDPRMVELLEEAHAKVESPGLSVRLLARLAAAKQPAPAPEEPIALAREAIARARELREPATLLHALHYGMAAMMDFVHPRERRPLNFELVALATQLGDRTKALRAHLRSAFDCIELADFPGVASCIAAYEAASRDLRHPSHHWPIPLCRSMVAMVTGDFAECERQIDLADPLIEQQESPIARVALLYHRLILARTRADLAALRAAEAPLRAAMGATYPRGPWEPMMAGNIYAPLRDVDRVRDVLEQSDGMWETDGWNALWMAEGLFIVGDKARAAAIHARAPSDTASRWVSHGISGFACEGPWARLVALVAAAAEQWEDAERLFEQAQAMCDAAGARPWSAHVRAERAEAFLTRDPTRAATWLDEAEALSNDLGLTGLLTRIGELRARLGARVTAAAATGFELVRDGELWAVPHHGSTLRFKDSKGFQLLHRLMSQPGEPIHVLDLMAPAGEGIKPQQGIEVIDATARKAYQRRLAELEEELDDATAMGDLGRAERARAETDALTDELARAVGLGGRSRETSSSKERARVAVQRRLKDAIRRIAEQAPELGAYLEQAVQTGTFCCYQPPPRAATPASEDRARLQSEKIASLGDLVAGIAHEMNTPLGALRANVDMANEAWGALREALADAELAEVLSKHKRLMRALQVLERTQGVTPEATHRIAGVVDQLRSFARLDQAEVGRLDLRDAAENALVLSSHKLGQRIEVTRRFVELPPIVCRAALINQVVMSLITNSIQAIADTGVIIVETARSGTDAVLRVTDSGVGITREHLDRIFDPGFTTRGVGVGLGLGLSLSHRIATEHGGRIEVESVPSKGSTFTLRLPFEPS